MFEINKSAIDIFTVAHFLMPFLIARTLAHRSFPRGRWWPFVVVLAGIALCEPLEWWMAHVGIRSFAESPLNVFTDLLVSAPSAFIGFRAGETTRERSAAARRHSLTRHTEAARTEQPT